MRGRDDFVQQWYLRSVSERLTDDTGTPEARGYGLCRMAVPFFISIMAHIGPTRSDPVLAAATVRTKPVTAFENSDVPVLIYFRCPSLPLAVTAT